MKEKMKERLFKISDWFDEIQAFTAVRQGLVMLIPLIILASLALMFISLPVAPYQRFLSALWDGKVIEILYFVYSGVFQFFAVLLAVTTSFSYAMMMQQNKRAGMGDSVIAVVITLTALAGYSGIQYKNYAISSLGTNNTFTALFISLLTCWMYFRLKEWKIFQMKQMSAEADHIYKKAISGILPAMLVLLFFAVFKRLFSAVFHVASLQDLLEMAINSLFQKMGTGSGSGLIVLLLTHSMWFLGIHGSNVMEETMQRNFVEISSTEIYNKTFQDVFVILGGTGSILCLVIAILIFSKKKSVRKVAKLAFPTTIFNINEVIVFGLPVLLNPIFLIPYIVVPICCHFISYMAIYTGLVPHVVQEVEWTAPILLNGYQATHSIAGSMLQLFCLAVGVCIYLPFLKLFEEQSERRFRKNVKQLVAELQYQEENNSISNFTHRNDILGSTARLMADDLKEAIANRELFLLYQPQVNQDEVCIGAEVLLRWMHPIVGFVYPPLIIELAKEEGMLQELETFLFDETAAAIAKIGEHVESDFKLSANITNESLAWDGFEKCMEESVRKYQIPRERFWLEITERDALVSTIEIMNKLQRLRDQGHKFLIDDFGMGHTSLLYLQSNHFEVVKLDGALTRNILENTRDGDIIASIVYLGKSLHFTTMAEYVETQEQRDRLAELGCDGFQGYLYSKPIKLEELIPWMKAHS